MGGGAGRRGSAGGKGREAVFTALGTLGGVAEDVFGGSGEGPRNWGLGKGSEKELRGVPVTEGWGKVF